MWAVSFETQQSKDDNCELYQFFNNLLTKTGGATWSEKVNNGEGKADHLLLWEHYVGEARDMWRAAAAYANWKLSIGKTSLHSRLKNI